MDTWWQDARYGARQLLRSPGSTVVIVLTLALGIGANTAIFSVINSVALRPLPINDTEALVFVHRSTPQRPLHGHSYPEYRDYLEQSESFAGLAAYSLMPLVFGDGERTRQVFGEIVAGDYFSVLAIATPLGRPLSEQDHDLAAAPAVVVGHGFWVRHLDEDPSWIGRTVVLSGRAFTVVGVAPRSFTGTTPGVATDFWMPATVWSQLVGEQYRLRRPEGYGHHWLQIVGRLEPEIRVDQAAAELTLTAHRSAPPDDPDQAAVSVVLSPVAAGNPGLRSELLSEGLPFVFALLVFCAVLLLVPCANAANLLLARAAARRHEIAVRLTLGSGRGRLMRQLLVESLLLAALAGVGGFLIAFWTTRLLAVVELPLALPTLALDLELDWRVLSCLFLLPLATGVAFGLLPALESTRPDLAGSLKAEIATIGGRVAKLRVRDVVVVTQVAVSLLLLVVAGLFARGLLRAFLVDPGFQSANVLLLPLDPPGAAGPATRPDGFHRRLLERLLETPSVESATVVAPVPLSFATSVDLYSVAGDDGLVTRRLPHTYAGPGYFETLGIPLLRGRTFGFADDESAPLVAIVNETMARQVWPARDAIGQRIRSESGEVWIEIIGVARDAKNESLGEPPRPWVYLPAFQHLPDVAGDLTLLVHTTGEPMAASPEVGRALREVDASYQALPFQTLAESVEIQFLIPRLGATIVGICGVLGVLLAMVGLAGVVSQAITQRTREIGVRVALGARASQVLRSVLGRSLMLASIGVVAGGAVAAGLSLALFQIPFVSYLLFGIGPLDPLVLAGGSALVFGAALLAGWLPARRALRVSPIVALRCD